MTKFTKRMIENLEVRDKDYFIWESELAGFGVRVFPSGRIKFVLQYRHGRIARRMTIAQFGAVTVDQARGLPFRLWGSFAMISILSKKSVSGELLYW